MKNIILSSLVMAFVLVSCNQKNEQAETTNAPMMNNDSTMMNKNTEMMDQNLKTYSCPMHPEVHGKLNDKCSKCGMELTEEVK